MIWFTLPVVSSNRPVLRSVMRFTLFDTLLSVLVKLLRARLVLLVSPAPGMRNIVSAYIPLATHVPRQISAAAPGAPVLPLSRGKPHTRGNIWSFTVG